MTLYEQRLAMAWTDLYIAWWIIGPIFFVLVTCTLLAWAAAVRNVQSYVRKDYGLTLILLGLTLICSLGIAGQIYDTYRLTHYPEAYVGGALYTIEKTEK